jgi:hypothetical protein
LLIGVEGAPALRHDRAIHGRCNSCMAQVEVYSLHRCFLAGQLGLKRAHFSS